MDINTPAQIEQSIGSTIAGLFVDHVLAEIVAMALPLDGVAKATTDKARRVLLEMAAVVDELRALEDGSDRRGAQ